MKNDNLKEQYRINERIRVLKFVQQVTILRRCLSDRSSAENSGRAGDGSSRDFTKCCAPRLQSNRLPEIPLSAKKASERAKSEICEVVVKEIRFGPQTDDHDYNFKLKHAKGFLEEGSKVKAYVFFKGRSILFKEQGEVLLLRFANDLEDYGKVEQLPYWRENV